MKYSVLPSGDISVFEPVQRSGLSIDEIGVFEMRQDGLKEVENPSALFLNDRDRGALTGGVVHADATQARGADPGARRLPHRDRLADHPLSHHQPLTEEHNMSITLHSITFDAANPLDRPKRGGILTVPNR